MTDCREKYLKNRAELRENADVDEEEREGSFGLKERGVCLLMQAEAEEGNRGRILKAEAKSTKTRTFTEAPWFLRRLT